MVYNNTQSTPKLSCSVQSCVTRRLFKVHLRHKTRLKDWPKKLRKTDKFHCYVMNCSSNDLFTLLSHNLGGSQRIFSPISFFDNGER